MNRRQTKTYELNELLAILQGAGIPCKRSGKELEADFNGTGHASYKLAPHKGVFFDAATGNKGTIAALLRRKGISATAIAPAANSTPRPAAGGQQPDTKAQAEKIWKQSWVCTHEADMPSGWDHGLAVGAKGAKRMKLEQERGAAIAYLRSRLGDTHLLHWLRQGRIGRTLDGQPMLVLPMQQGGALSGIQRVILNAQGQKIERKMLGKIGVLPLPAPAGVRPVQLLPESDSSPCILIGEGFDTTATPVQSCGHSGIATMFDGGIRAWADQQSALAAKATPEQLAKAPAAIILVDRDVSGAGQRAAAYAVRTLRAAGLKAFYAEPLPPEQGGPQGGPKGSDWNDYIKEGLAHAIIPHLQLAIAHGDEIMPEPEPGASSSTTAPVFDFAGYRPAEEPAAVAETAEVEEARAEMQTQLQRIVKEYVEWAGTDPEHRSPFLPEIFHITTGVGKSQAAKDLADAAKSPIIRIEGARVVVSVPDHEQAMDYEKAGFFHFWGRQSDESRAPQALCQNFAEMEQAQERGHVSQAEFCRKCSHGLAWSIRTAQKEIDSGTCTDARAATLQDRIDEHTAELRRRGLRPDQVEPCRWQSHLREAINSQFVVMTHQSYSHSVVGDSLFFADEGFELAKTVQIDLSDIHEWAAKNANILNELKRLGANPEHVEKHERAADLFRILAARMAFWAAEGKDGEVRTDVELSQAIEDLMALTKKRVSLAAWEVLDFNKQGHLQAAPLRAAYALAESLRHIGGGHIAKGRLIVAAVSPIVERVKIGLPVIFLDATPPRALVEIVQANEGKIHRLIARQNVRILRHPSRFWGLSALDERRTDTARVQRELSRYQAIFAAHPEAAHLIHKKAADQLPEREGLGHWGRHHRAHNGWSGKDLAIVGSFFPPESAWRSLYQADRLAALASGCDPAAWPNWPETAATADGVWIAEGSHEVQSRLPLPEDPHIRAWLLDRITAETVQAIGRVRGANSSREITVRIFGGVPLEGLGAHGLQVAEYAADPAELGQTRQQVNADRHEAAMEKMDAAAARLIAKGQTITTETMAAEMQMQATGTDGIGIGEDRFYGHGIDPLTKPVESKNPAKSGISAFSASTYQKWLDRIRQVAPALYAHMATTGRGAGVVRAMREASARYGEKALKFALHVTETLIKKGDEELWQALDLLSDDMPEHLAATMIIEAVLGEGPPQDIPMPI